MSCSALLQSSYRMVESRISTGFPFGFLIATSVPGETPAQEAKPTIPTTGPDKEALVPLHPKGLRNRPPYLSQVGIGSSPAAAHNRLPLLFQRLIERNSLAH